jgi:hypothetical protein
VDLEIPSRITANWRGRTHERFELRQTKVLAQVQARTVLLHRQDHEEVGVQGKGEVP